MITGINHITFQVVDIQESFDFFVDVLGFKPIMKSKWSAYFQAGDTWLAVTRGEYRSDDRYDHLAFNLDKASYDTLVARLKERGVEEWKENVTEGESFYFLDPSGNKFELHYSTIEDRISDGKANWGEEVEWYV